MWQLGTRLRKTAGVRMKHRPSIRGARSAERSQEMTKTNLTKSDELNQEGKQAMGESSLQGEMQDTNPFLVEGLLGGIYLVDACQERCWQLERSEKPIMADEFISDAQKVYRSGGSSGILRRVPCGEEAQFLLGEIAFGQVDLECLEARVSPFVFLTQAPKAFGLDVEVLSDDGMLLSDWLKRLSIELLAESRHADEADAVIYETAIEIMTEMRLEILDSCCACLHSFAEAANPFDWNSAAIVAEQMHPRGKCAAAVVRCAAEILRASQEDECVAQADEDALACPVMEAI